MAKSKTEEKIEVKEDVSDVLKSYLKENKAFHYNFEEDNNYRTSSGSLLLDIELGGGLPNGAAIFSGIAEGGKSSCALSFMNNFLKDKKNRMGIYIKAEGRLSEEMIARTGIEFVKNPDDWKDGTCFIFETNVYEVAISLIRKLVQDNLNNKKYFFIVDSVDSLVPQADFDKSFTDANKVAAGALLTSDFFKRMSIGLAKRGHTALLLKQVRSQVQLNPYAKSDPRLTNSSGGSAIQHYANWIFEFQQRFKDDHIWKDSSKKEAIGHYCKIIFRKSANEKSGRLVTYPIKYWRKNGTSVWLEYEVADMLLAWDLGKISGAWINFSKEFIDEILKETAKVFPESIQGIDRLRKFLEENQEITQYLFNKFKKTLST